MWFANFRMNQPCFRLDCRERYSIVSLAVLLGQLRLQAMELEMLKMQLAEVQKK